MKYLEKLFNITLHIFVESVFKLKTLVAKDELYIRFNNTQSFYKRPSDLSSSVSDHIQTKTE